MNNKYITIPNQEHIQLKPLPLVTQLIRAEMENIDISKKYTGFKYLVDIISYSLYNNITDAYSYQMFDFIASINHVSSHNVERDIRHMLITCYKKSEKLKSTISKNNKLKINARNILNNLIIYVKCLV